MSSRKRRTVGRIDLIIGIKDCVEIKNSGVYFFDKIKKIFRDFVFISDNQTDIKIKVLSPPHFHHFFACFSRSYGSDFSLL